MVWWVQSNVFTQIRLCTIKEDYNFDGGKNAMLMNPRAPRHSRGKLYYHIGLYYIVWKRARMLNISKPWGYLARKYNLKRKEKRDVFIEYSKIVSKWLKDVCSLEEENIVLVSWKWKTGIYLIKLQCIRFDLN